MKYLPLLWTNLKRKKTRTLFTLLSVTAAFMLFGLLLAVRQGFLGAINIVGGNRLETSPKVFATGALPLSYANRIARVPGVAAITPISGFGAYYQDKKRTFVMLAVDPQAMLRVYPEIKTPGAGAAAWKRDRVGAMVGVDLARRFGWKVGERIPVNALGDGIVKKNGGHTWDVKIDSIYHMDWGGRFNSYFFIHYKYLDESRAEGSGTVGEYDVRIDDPERAAAVSETIDSMFVNAAPQTETQPQKAAVQNQLEQFGNVGAIVTAIAVAVFFSMLLVTANTMGQAVRERTAELAVLKALGFGNGGMIALVLAESLVITAIGGVTGLGFSYWLVEYLKADLMQFFSTFGFSDVAFVMGLGLTVVFGVLSGLLPAIEVARLGIVNALRRA